MFDSAENLEQPGAPRTFINRMAYKVGAGVGFGLAFAITTPCFIFVGVRARMKGEDHQAAILETRDKIMNFISA